MSSGYGAFGGKSQCYRFWQGFQECRVSELASLALLHLGHPYAPLSRPNPLTLSQPHPTPPPSCLRSLPFLSLPLCCCLPCLPCTLAHTQPTSARATSALALVQLHASTPVVCLLEQADYQECLHREKLKRRIASKAMEVNARKEPVVEAHGHGH
jgi:hypothetical protein